MSEQLTTRMAPRFASQLSTLRAGLSALSNEDERRALLERFERLAYDLSNGYPVLEQVPLSVAQAELEAERALELPSDTDVSGLLDDSESTFSGLRDNREVA